MDWDIMKKEKPFTVANFSNEVPCLLTSHASVSPPKGEPTIKRKAVNRTLTIKTHSIDTKIAAAQRLAKYLAFPLRYMHEIM
jgi:hypothetical protein